MSRKFALVIGNSEYHDTGLAQLKSPGLDAYDLAGALRSPEIGAFDEVLTLINEAEANVRRAVARFFLNRKPDDLLLLYFSGHGVRDDQGQLYLAVKDTDRMLLSATAIPADFVTGQMDLSRSKRQVLILDCCNSGAFDRAAKSGGAGSSMGTATAFEGVGYGRVVLTASDSTQYAWEGDDVIGEAANSVFTRYLVQGLETGEADVDNDGLISLDEWYDYVYAHVVGETPRQTPGKWSYKQQGDLIVAKNPKPRAPRPVELPQELRQALESPLAYVREGLVRELSRLLQGSDPTLAQAAREALMKLGQDDSRRVSTAASEALAAHAAVQQAQEKELAERERQAAQKAEEERQAREAKRAQEERLTRERAEAQRSAEARAEQERVARETQRAEQERLAQAKVEAERVARQRAEEERLTRERAEQDRLAQAQAQAERVARQKAEAERLTREKAEAQRRAREAAEKTQPSATAVRQPEASASQSTAKIQTSLVWRMALGWALGWGSLTMLLVVWTTMRSGSALEMMPPLGLVLGALSGVVLVWNLFGLTATRTQWGLIAGSWAAGGFVSGIAVSVLPSGSEAETIFVGVLLSLLLGGGGGLGTAYALKQSGAVVRTRQLVWISLGWAAGIAAGIGVGIGLAIMFASSLYELVKDFLYSFSTYEFAIGVASGVVSAPLFAIGGAVAGVVGSFIMLKQLGGAHRSR